jgi:hypothetical protein
VANLTHSFLINCKARVQHSGLRVAQFVLTPAGFYDVLGWAGPSFRSFTSTKAVAPSIIEYGTLWGSVVWVDVYQNADTVQVVDDTGFIHVFPYPCVAPVSQLVLVGSTGPVVLDGSVTEVVISTECPCGILRIDCDYHRSI